MEEMTRLGADLKMPDPETVSMNVSGLRVLKLNVEKTAYSVMTAEPGMRIEKTDDYRPMSPYYCSKLQHTDGSFREYDVVELFNYRAFSYKFSWTRVP